MHGWSGKIIEVDLSAGRVWRDEIPPEILREYLGGRGLGVRLLCGRHTLDPFAPEIPLIFAAGPLAGSGAPVSARMAIVSRSPLTGTTFDAACGGSFPLLLKGCGADAIRIVGASNTPVVLHIRGEKADILPADDLWGKGVDETLASLATGGSALAIGPGGENGVLFAGIVTSDGDCQVRGGLGAVMGRKMLKGIVADGDRAVSVADPGRFDTAATDVMRLFRASPVIFGELGLAGFGSPALVDLVNQRRMTPTENFRATYFPGAGNYSGPAIRREYRPESVGCGDCQVRCLKVTQAGGTLPPFDHLSHLGALNGVSDLGAIVKADGLCRDLGLDAVSAAATISAWGEWRGKFADGDELATLLMETASRRDRGELLALGSRRAMEELGAPELSMSVKSLELPAYDPRGAYGLALAYCTGNRGGCQQAAYPISHEILRKPVATDRFSFSGKARMNKTAEDALAVIDSMALCRYSLFGAGLEEFSALLTAATGMEYTPDSLGRIGERIYLLERFYNRENGIAALDDRLPERFFTEAGSGGEGIEIPPIERTRLDEELRKYYRIRGFTADGEFAVDDFLDRIP